MLTHATESTTFNNCTAATAIFQMAKMATNITQIGQYLQKSSKNTKMVQFFWSTDTSELFVTKSVTLL